MVRLRDALGSPGVGGVLARGALAAFAVRAGAVLTLLGLHVILARILGVASYGHYVYAVTWVQVLALLSASGMDSASTRYVAQYLAKGNSALLDGFLRHARTLALVVSVAFALALGGVVLALGSRLDLALSRAFMWGAVLLPAVALLEVRSGAIRGFKRVVLARLPVEVLRPALVAVGACILYFTARSTVNAPLLMEVNVAATAMALVVVEIGLRNCRPTSSVTRNPASLPRREWSKVGFQLLLVAGFGLVLGQTDTLMLGALRSTSDAGIYAVSVRLAAFVSFALVSVEVMIGPQIAELHAGQRQRELQRILTLGARVSLAFALIIVVALVLGSAKLLGLFGSEFDRGRTALLVLACGQFVNCLAGSVVMLMTMTGNQKIVAWTLGSTAALNVALNGLLIPRFGMLGAATATTIAMVSWNAVLVTRARLLHRIDTTVFALGIRRR